MLSKNERMEKLNKAGYDTSKYFTVDLDNGTKIHLIIDENGDCKQVKDPIAEQIFESGYVKNTRLHRRFIMAQMFAAINYVSYDRKYKGYNDCLKRMYGYYYTFKMMLDEVKVLSKLETRDKESFDERSHFFTKEVVADVMEDYVRKLMEYIDKLPDHKCKGVPYKKVKGVNIFNADLNKKIYGPLANKVFYIRHAKNYGDVHRILSDFMRNMIKIPYNTPKSKDWIDAYKGEGAFYTCKNLIMFHDCKVHDSGAVYTRDGSMKVLNRRLDEYKGEGWRMFAFMKKLIEDNNFNFKDAMAKVYGEK